MLSISVIITCFNYEHYVEYAIRSVLAQCEARCELLVVDDGSSDDSWTIIQGFGLDKVFRVPNMGAARAGLHALRHASAPFVLFLDADDALAPGSLARIIARLDPDVAKLQFPLLPVDGQGRIIGPPTPRLPETRGRVRFRRQVMRTGVYASPPTSGNVFRRDVCDLLTEVDYEMSVDGVTLFAAPFLGDIVSLSVPLGFYRLHDRNYSQSGSSPTARRFRLEADRFVQRHDHLRRVLARRGVAAALPDARATFFYRERRLYQHLLEGGRPSPGQVAILLWLVLRQRAGVKNRTAMTLFLAACLVLPRSWRDGLLSRRFRPRRGWSALPPRYRTSTLVPPLS